MKIVLFVWTFFVEANTSCRQCPLEVRRARSAYDRHFRACSDIFLYRTRVRNNWIGWKDGSCACKTCCWNTKRNERGIVFLALSFTFLTFLFSWHFFFKLDVLLKRAKAAEITAMEASNTLDEVTNQIVSMAALLLGHRKRLKCTTQAMVQGAIVCLTDDELAGLRRLVSSLNE